MLIYRVSYVDVNGFGSHIMLESWNYIRIKDKFLWNYRIKKKKLIGNIHLKLLFIFNFNKKANKNFSDFTFY